MICNFLGIMVTHANIDDADRDDVSDLALAVRGALAHVLQHVTQSSDANVSEVFSTERVAETVQHVMQVSHLS